MGFEFKIKFTPVEAELIDGRLRGHRFFNRFDETHNAYEFRRPNNRASTSMPNLEVRIENDGLYVNNLDAGMLMYEIAAIFLSVHDRIEIMNYE